MNNSAPEATDPSRRHSGSIARNAAFQVAGRLFVSAVRLAVAIVVIRLAGAERYGEYALILSILFIAEWLVDFGVVDIGVREASRNPERAQILLTVISVMAVFQALVAFLFVIGTLTALGYDETLVRAGMIGGMSLLFYASVVVLRIQFRTQMAIRNDSLGEAVGAIMLVVLVSIVGFSNGSLEALMACYLLSRIAQAATVLTLGGIPFRPGFVGAGLPFVRTVMAQAVPLGVGGLLFALNENMIPVALSKFASMDAVAEYQYAIRFVLPIIMIVQSLNVAFFPILSRYWGSDKDALLATQQNALETSVIVGGALFCLLNGGAIFFLGMAGDQFAQSATVFRLLSCVVLLQVITLPITPLIVVAGGVHKVLWLTACLVAAQFFGLLWLVPMYGTLGAVSAYLGVKLVVGTVPVVMVGQRVAGVRLAWFRPIRAIASAVAAVIAGELLFGLDSAWMALLCLAIYGALLFVVRVVDVNRMREIAASLSQSRGETRTQP